MTAARGCLTSNPSPPAPQVATFRLAGQTKVTTMVSKIRLRGSTVALAVDAMLLARARMLFF